MHILGLTNEHAVFDTVAGLTDVHEHVFGKDPLVAELTLTNTETGTQDVRRGDVIPVNWPEGSAQQDVFSGKR